MKQVAGLAMIATPFVAVAVYSVVTLGWLASLAVLGVVSATVVLITAGTHLASGR